MAGHSGYVIYWQPNMLQEQPPQSSARASAAFAMQRAPACSDCYHWVLGSDIGDPKTLRKANMKFGRSLIITASGCEMHPHVILRKMGLLP
jgi:hypothetical protein